MKKVVVFHKDSSPRVYYNIDVTKLKDDYLIDPIFPKRIPPHLWKKKNNKISVKFSFKYFWSFLKHWLL